MLAGWLLVIIGLKNLASSQISRWIKLLDGYLGEGGDDPLSPSHLGYNAYLENIESRYQGFIHKILCNTKIVYVHMAIFQELADLISSKSTTPAEDRPTISVSRKQVAKWFK